MTTIAIAVVAHPKRAQQAARLADELGAHVVMDDGEYGDAINHARAWEWLAGQDAEWALAIEDDAVLGENLRSRFSQTADTLPCDGMLVGYTGRDSRAAVSKRVHDGHTLAERRGLGFFAIRGVYWGVAVGARTQRAAAIAQHLRISPTHVRNHRGLMVRVGSDEMVSLWAASKRLPVFACHPDLVDHADDGSVLGNGKLGPRRALWFRG